MSTTWVKCNANNSGMDLLRMVDRLGLQIVHSVTMLAIVVARSGCVVDTPKRGWRVIWLELIHVFRGRWV